MEGWLVSWWTRAPVMRSRQIECSEGCRCRMNEASPSLYLAGSALAHAAINRQNLPGDEVAGLQKVHHCTSDLVRRASTPGGRRLNHGPAPRVDILEGNDARGYGIHGNIRRESLG